MPHRPDTAHLPADHPAVPSEKVGVLLLNLGTPDATDYWSIRRYLKEFLTDRRVIEVNPILWQIILNLFVLPRRPFKTGEAYEQIWLKDTNESPLRKITREQAEKLSERLAGHGLDIHVDWAMRYGNPSTASKIEAMQAAGCTRILLVALYPHYAAATTATAYDKAFDALKTLRWQPAVRTAPPYHDEPAFITALANSIRGHLAGLDWEPEVVIASYHGLPKRYFLAGDPYHCHCMKTTRLLREELGWPKERLITTFQSRFGKEEWLQPYTDITVEELAKAGTKRMAIVTPGFSADCVETLEEIAIGVRETFEEHGGEHFSFIPCLNDSPGGMDVIETIVMRELGGWIPAEQAARTQEAAE